MKRSLQLMTLFAVLLIARSADAQMPSYEVTYTPSQSVTAASGYVVPSTPTYAVPSAASYSIAPSPSYLSNYMPGGHVCIEYAMYPMGNGMWLHAAGVYDANCNYSYQTTVVAPYHSSSQYCPYCTQL